MALRVGIHENLIFSKAEKNERGTLVIGFKQAAELDAFAALNSGVDITQREQEFLIYPPKIENYDGQVDSPENIINKIKQIIDPLSQILLQFTTKDKVKWSIMDGTGATAENLNSKVTSASVVDKIYNNIVDQFVKMAKPFVNSPERLRVLFVRKNKAKHFPALRTKFLDSNPFIERMSVPVSNVKFTDWEKENGFDNPNPVDGAATVSRQEAKTADDLFKA